MGIMEKTMETITMVVFRVEVECLNFRVHVWT